MVCPTERNKKRVREDIDSEYDSRTVRDDKLVREDIESEYGFPHGNKWKTGTGRYIIMSTVCRTGKT